MQGIHFLYIFAIICHFLPFGNSQVSTFHFLVRQGWVNHTQDLLIQVQFQ